MTFTIPKGALRGLGAGASLISDRILEDNWNVAVGASAIRQRPPCYMTRSVTFVSPSSIAHLVIDGGLPT